MKEILRRLRRARVLVVGDVVVDHYVFGVTTRISREAPVPVVLHESDDIRPGGAANAAVNAASLGAKATLVGVVGPDAAGAAFRDCMKGRGVALRLVTQKGRATAEKMRVLAGAHGTGRQQVLRLDRDPAAPMTAKTVRSFVATLRNVATDGSQAVLLSDYGHGLMDTDVVAAVERLAVAGVPVLVDSRHALARVRGPVVLKPNQPELSDLVGRKVVTGEDTVQAARAVMRRCGARAVVATRGREGMIVVAASGKATALSAHGNGEVTDVTGAGDTVAAALISALAAGISLEDAARLANVAASVVVQKLGAATATPQEVIASHTGGETA